jgi:cytoskeletal protein RodZ
MVKDLDERGDPVSATHEADREVFSAKEARQGRRGMRILAVLLGGLFLALVVWSAVEIWGESVDSDRTAETEQMQQSPSAERTGSINPEESAPAILAPTDRDPTAQTGPDGESRQVSPDGAEN